MSEGGGFAVLDLRELGDGSMIGLSAAAGRALAEAASVCLDSQQHHMGVRLCVTGSLTANPVLAWKASNPQSRRSWRNNIDATEDGAAGIAILLVRKLLGFVVTSRSRHGTGFDYWLDRNVDVDPMHDKTRLEVSGIRRGSDSDVARRTREKVRQMEAGGVGGPGYTVVVEFGTPQAQVMKVDS